MMFLTSLSSHSYQEQPAYELSPGQVKYYEIYQDPSYQVVETDLGYPIGPLDLESEYLEAAFVANQLDLTASELSSLAYMRRIASIKEGQGNNFSGAIKHLIMDNQILYAGLPILVIILIVLNLEFEDEKHQKAFYRTLPLDSKSLIRRKLPLSLVLGLFYLLTVFLTTVLVSMARGEGLGNWSFPLRNLYNAHFLPAWLILGLLVVLFLIKLLLLVSVTYVLLALVKNARLTQFVSIMVILLASLLTNYYPTLQVNWNPLYTSVYDQVIGRLIVDPTWEPVTRYVHTGSPLSWHLLITWCLSAMLLIELATQLMSHTTRLLSPYSQSYDQNLDRLTVTDLKTLEMSMLDN